MSGFAYELERNELKKTNLAVFRVGDSVDVHVRIKEGEKERVQIFSGICIARKGTGLRETFTVRRIVEGEGVERVFPLHSPNVTQIVVTRSGVVRRAKLYYMRGREGKGARIKERVNARYVGKLDEHRNAKGAKAAAPAEKAAEKAEEKK